MADQQAIVDHYQGGYKAVLAAPGSGKTTLVSRLIVHLIQNQKVSATSILVLTFTESAAQEFEQRTRLLLEPLARMPHFATIHGFCNRLLKQLHSAYADRQVASEERRYALISQVLDAFKLWHSELDYARLCADYLIPRYRLAGYRQHPADAQELHLLSGIDSEHAELLLRLPDLIQSYEHLLSAAQLIDYDMMISETLALLEQQPRLLAHLQQRYQYLFEDEAQDSNPLQARLLELIAGESGNLLRVGDPNQSIYAFGGADYRSLQNFAQEHGSYPMGQSNRSSQQMMSLANAFHHQYNQAFPSAVQLRAGVSNPAEGWLWIKSYPQIQSELHDMVQACRRLLEQQQSIAVLCRTNLACQWLHQQLQQARVPVVLHHDRIDHFFQSEIVQRVKHLLDYLLQPDQYHLLQQILIEQGVSRQSLKLLLNPQEPVAELLHALQDGVLFHPAVPTFEYQLLMKQAQSLLFIIERLHYPISQILEWMAESLISDVEIRSQLRLLHALWQQTQSTPMQSIEQFRNWLDQAGVRKIRQALIPEALQESLTNSGVVHVLTAHKAKGLEWDAVLMPLFQFGKGFKSADQEVRTLMAALQAGEPYIAVMDQMLEADEAENIRLAYVGMTRARRFLSITASQEACRAAGIYQSELSPLFVSLQQIYRDLKSKA